MKHLFITILSTFALLVSAEAQFKKHPEITEKKREVAALATLKSTPGTIKIYARGMCCESCGIGIRKKLQKLEFVDTGRFNKGIALDAKTQLVTVAIKKGATIDVEAIKKAVKAAGYDPVKLYELKGGRLKSTQLEK